MRMVGDVTNLFCIFLVTLLVLRQVSGLTLSFFQLTLLAVIPTITYTVSPIVGYLGSPIYFICLDYYFESSKNKLLSIFCGIYALSVEALFTRFILFYFIPIFTGTASGFNKNIFVLIGLELLLVPSHYLFVRVLRIDYGKLKKITNGLRAKLLIPFVIVMGFYYIIIDILIILEFLEIFPQALVVREHLTLLFSLLFLMLMLRINYRMTEELDKEVRSLKDRQLISLANYSQHVEALYREIRSFRHDYTNILVSLNESIRQGDIQQIRQVYDAVIADSDKKFYDGKYDVASLANVKDAAVKSILSAKLIEAQKQGINISVEVEHEISIKQIELLDFITILSIFLDNAIEAATLATRPEILVAYFEEKKQIILVIENSTKDVKINTNRIFDDGYSTKGEGRGIGLTNVSQIIKQHSNLSLVTSSNDYRFSQTLKIDSKESDERVIT